ncbi:hypothetical protein DB32_005563 [Sandaracinus amylolyticus]|uniref:Uncharacterized protein n=1 Tax=Sandaracinus amylolyticus TaxID=927083 RepID=A0A0F6SGB7_9BACT|nr:hypothetical protein DB32_005563 [Sandaracinus amylolyticus]
MRREGARARASLDAVRGACLFPRPDFSGPRRAGAPGGMFS